MHIVHFFKPDDELHRAVTKKIPQNAFFFSGLRASEILESSSIHNSIIYGIHQSWPIDRFIRNDGSQQPGILRHKFIHFQKALDQLNLVVPQLLVF